MFEIPVECNSDDQCAVGRRCIDGECSQSDGTYSTDPCPTAGEVGRCRYNQGTLGEVETVYYAPTFTGAEADLQDGCEDVLQGLWIPAG